MKIEVIGIEETHSVRKGERITTGTRRVGFVYKNHKFDPGKTYDVPSDIGEAWIQRGIAKAKKKD